MKHFLPNKRIHINSCARTGIGRLVATRIGGRFDSFCKGHIFRSCYIHTLGSIADHNGGLVRRNGEQYLLITLINWAVVARTMSVSTYLDRSWHLKCLFTYSKFLLVTTYFFGISVKKYRNRKKESRFIVHYS